MALMLLFVALMVVDLEITTETGTMLFLYVTSSYFEYVFEPRGRFGFLMCLGMLLSRKISIEVIDVLQNFVTEEDY
jgi:hypothetical protein